MPLKGREPSLGLRGGWRRYRKDEDKEFVTVTPKVGSTPSVSNKSQTPAALVTSLDSDVLKIGDSVLSDNLSCDVKKDSPVAGEMIGMDTVTDDVKATMDNILSIVCETSAVGDITNNDSVTRAVKATNNKILSIACETSDKTAAEKPNAQKDYPSEDETKKATKHNILSIVGEIPAMEGNANNGSVTDDVKATIDNILSIVCATTDKTAADETYAENDYTKDEDKTKMATIDKSLSMVREASAVDNITDNDSVTNDVKATIDDILSIVGKISDETAADKTNAEDDYHKLEETKEVEADETVTLDGKHQPEVIIPEPINRPFLYDSEIAIARTMSKPPGPRRLIPWNDFDDVTIDDDVLNGKDGQSWDCEDMFEYNEIHFGYKSSLDNDLSEYTTPLVREDTEEDRLRYERACRLADEIKTKKLADQAAAAQVPKKKKRKKKTNKDNIPT